MSVASDALSVVMQSVNVVTKSCETTARQNLLLIHQHEQLKATVAMLAKTIQRQQELINTLGALSADQLKRHTDLAETVNFLSRRVGELENSSPQKN
jgi:hypothetical protein